MFNPLGYMDKGKNKIFSAIFRGVLSSCPFSILLSFASDNAIFKPTNEPTNLLDDIKSH